MPQNIIKCMKMCTLTLSFHTVSLLFLPCLSEPEYKRARQEIKKKSSDTLKLQKKAKKGKKIFLNQSLGELTKITLLRAVHLIVMETNLVLNHVPTDILNNLEHCLLSSVKNIHLKCPSDN